MESTGLEAAVGSGAYDFLDFGCSRGGSIERALRLFRARRGLGIDVCPEKVEATREAGYDAVVHDVTDLKLDANAVRFVTMSHFLEHLPGVETARACLESAAAVAREFVFIRQPFFDADGYLFERGLKLYWSDWSGHQFHMTSLQLHNLLAPMLEMDRIARYVIYAQGLVPNSDEDAIHPLASPVDQHAWQAHRHPAKPFLSFQGNVFRQLKALVVLDPDVSAEALQKRFHWDRILFDSAQ